MPKPSWLDLAEIASEALFNALEGADDAAESAALRTEKICLDWADRLPPRSPDLELALTALMDAGCYFWPKWPPGIHKIVLKYGGIETAAKYILNVPDWSIKGYPTRKPGEFAYIIANRAIIAELDSQMFWSQVPILPGAPLTSQEMAFLN